MSLEGLKNKHGEDFPCKFTAEVRFCFERFWVLRVEGFRAITIGVWYDSFSH